MQNSSDQVRFCAACGYQNEISYKFCSGCGAQFPLIVTPIPSTTQVPPDGLAGKRLVLIGVILFAGCGLLGVLGGVLTHRPADRPRASIPAPSVSSGENQMELAKQKMRDSFAEQLQSQLIQSGCTSCQVNCAANILILTHPHTDPEDAARQLLGEKTTARSMKELGFATLRVRQSTGLYAEIFDYNVK